MSTILSNIMIDKGLYYRLSRE